MTEYINVVGCGASIFICEFICAINILTVIYKLQCATAFTLIDKMSNNMPFVDPDFGGKSPIAWCFGYGSLVDSYAHKGSFILNMDGEGGFKDTHCHGTGVHLNPP